MKSTYCIFNALECSCCKKNSVLKNGNLDLTRIKDISHWNEPTKVCWTKAFWLKDVCVCVTCRSVYGCVVNRQEPIKHSFKVSDEKFKESVPKLSQESIQYIYNKRAHGSLQRISLPQTFCQELRLRSVQFRLQHFSAVPLLKCYKSVP